MKLLLLPVILEAGLNATYDTFELRDLAGNIVASKALPANFFTAVDSNAPTAPEEAAAIAQAEAFFGDFEGVAFVSAQMVDSAQTGPMLLIVLSGPDDTTDARLTGDAEAEMGYDLYPIPTAVEVVGPPAAPGTRVQDMTVGAVVGLLIGRSTK